MQNLPKESELKDMWDRYELREKCLYLEYSMELRYLNNCMVESHSSK